MKYDYKIVFRCGNADATSTAIDSIKSYNIFDGGQITRAGSEFIVIASSDTPPQRFSRSFQDKVDILIPEIRGYSMTVTRFT